MTLQKNLSLLRELRLCLIAGNEVNLISRKPPLRVTAIKRSFDKGERGTVIRAQVDGKWLTLLSGEKLRTTGTYGREWTV